MAEAASPACSDVALRLGQHPRAPDTTADFELQWPRYPERLQPVLSQCQTKEQVDRELRDDYEIHRRSANMTLHEYLDTLRRVHAEERSRYIHELCPSQEKGSSTVVAVELREPDSNAPDNTTTREQWRLKILGDSLSRDLLAMQETLELLLIARKKPEQSSSKWDLFLPRFWFCVGLL
ncbi:hypothetical protein BBK36DRAFT_1157502 [Trichoderma citrinoviride]|uniref:Uncharacterized protein n=1 Tax=Trichoderma citrinoviride TaxID=58853 RepID=A0A2T4BET2_9HYPO|nr:hypothetical protein BBK36DRAFT_1157502 [Trichoderma citrinoviride]PTB67816.1 hypothetical protein BBK36DRAFT_1157502 [Trichoderma citrinoviride]